MAELCLAKLPSGDFHWTLLILSTLDQVMAWCYQARNLNHNELVTFQSSWFALSISMVYCRHAYAWQIGPFWQDTLDLCVWLVIIMNATKDHSPYTYCVEKLKLGA